MVANPGAAGLLGQDECLAGHGQRLGGAVQVRQRADLVQQQQQPHVHRLRVVTDRGQPQIGVRDHCHAVPGVRAHADQGLMSVGGGQGVTRLLGQAQRRVTHPDRLIQLADNTR